MVYVVMKLSEGNELLNLAGESLPGRENTLPVFWNLRQCLFGEHNSSQFKTSGRLYGFFAWLSFVSRSEVTVGMDALLC